MKETRIPNLNIDPVGVRLERIVEEKKSANDEALGRIKSLTGNWEELNKSLESDIKDEFELMDLEDQALAEALEDLKENRNNPDKESFIISGKVLSLNEQVGLPNVNVILLQKKEGEGTLLGTAVTDTLGNFAFSLNARDVAGSGQRRLQVEFQVVAGDGSLLHSEVASLTPRLGGVAQVTLAIAETGAVSNQLEAGKAVKDSILDSRDLVASRVENMRGANDALTKMAEITRDELDILHEELAVTPPKVMTTLVKPALEPESGPVTTRPTTTPTPVVEKPITDEGGSDNDEPARPDRPTRPTRPARPTRSSHELIDIDGIGPSRVKQLKRAEIRDIETFINTDDSKLTKILGDLDFKAMKEHGKKLLKDT